MQAMELLCAEGAERGNPNMFVVIFFFGFPCPSVLSSATMPLQSARFSFTINLANFDIKAGDKCRQKVICNRFNRSSQPKEWGGGKLNFVTIVSLLFHTVTIDVRFALILFLQKSLLSSSY